MSTVCAGRYYNAGTHHYARIDSLLHRSFLVDQYRTHCLHNCRSFAAEWQCNNLNWHNVTVTQTEMYYNRHAQDSRHPSWIYCGSAGFQDQAVGYIWNSSPHRRKLVLVVS